ncbi:hypothetical protein M0813_25594 [Anaeramoeba flamelloides]|uniref:Uncharacterized protein n=1 Tax=Anaeramoeba flamelloides TaxID=1746091 RepID=A0ABQ8Y2L7_9EUKA|nr:hypothetical protein M0813_25594 [Anaeramoeba flamelloides]
MLLALLWIIGFITCLRLLHKLVQFVWYHFFRPLPNLRKNFESDKWAVITGGSDGIGKEFALELAKQGFSLVLLSRTESKLNDVKSKALERNPNIKVIVHPIDLSQSPLSIRDEIIGLLDPLEIGVLVNNVGLSIPACEFHLQNDRNNKLLSSLNIKIHLLMTKLVTSKWIKSNQQGYLINLSSSSGIVGSPWISVYSGTKGWIDTWSRSLGSEFEHIQGAKKITVHSLQPSFVSTKMTGMRPSLLCPHPKVIPIDCFRQIQTHTSIAPYWIHALFNGFFRAFPQIGGWFMNKEMKKLLIRVKRYQKKQLEKQKQLENHNQEKN